MQSKLSERDKRKRVFETTMATMATLPFSEVYTSLSQLVNQTQFVYGLCYVCGTWSAMECYWQPEWQWEEPSELRVGLLSSPRIGWVHCSNAMTVTLVHLTLLQCTHETQPHTALCLDLAKSVRVRQALTEVAVYTNQSTLSFWFKWQQIRFDSSLSALSLQGQHKLPYPDRKSGYKAEQ